jgi:uroporphyrinogen-III synthase
VSRDRRPPRPLAGRTIVITRPADQSDDLVRLLQRRGARTIVAPAIQIAPIRSAALTRALADLAAGGYEWITLTSRATVDMLSRRLASGEEVEARVAVIGDGTAGAFQRWARRDPDLRSPTFTTAALARAFPRGHGRVLCLRADIAPEGLEDALIAKGWSPDRVEAYRTRMPLALPKEARDALRHGEVDAVTFTSASTVRGFVGALGAVKGTPKVVCIGPVTAREARGHGLSVSAVARPHTMEGVVDALERVFRSRGSSTR